MNNILTSLFTSTQTGAGSTGSPKTLTNIDFTVKLDRNSILQISIALLIVLVLFALLFSFLLKKI